MYSTISGKYAEINFHLLGKYAMGYGGLVWFWNTEKKAIDENADKMSGGKHQE